MQVVARLASMHFCVEIHSIQASIVVNLFVQVQQERYPLVNIRLPIQVAFEAFPSSRKMCWLGSCDGTQRGLYCRWERGGLCCSCWSGGVRHSSEFGPRAASYLFCEVEQWYSSHGHNQSALAVWQLVQTLEL